MYAKDDFFKPTKLAKNQNLDMLEYEYEKGIDFAMVFHLGCGLVWLCMGSFQIIMARHGWTSEPGYPHRAPIRGTAHKRFGYVAFFLLLPHGRSYQHGLIPKSSPSCANDSSCPLFGYHCVDPIHCWWHHVSDRLHGEKEYRNAQRDDGVRVPPIH
jgi:hypothetical protein